MKRRFKIIAAAGIAACLCLAAAYWLALSHWTERPAAAAQPPEKKIMWTGVISTTNGWEFKLENIINFGKRNVRHVEFCKNTRQLFIVFGDWKDNPLYQWDVDKCKRVYTFHFGKGFCPFNFAVSPDGKYLIVKRYTTQAQSSETRTSIIDIVKQSVVRELGDIGSWSCVYFSPDGTKMWLDAVTLENMFNGAAFKLDGTPIKNFSKEDFPESRDPRLWQVGQSKSPPPPIPGLYYKDRSGTEHLLAEEAFGWNDYVITKDERLIVAANLNDEIVIWDGETAKEIVRQRITDHEELGGYVIYDDARDRFLIADPSSKGTTRLRALRVTKRPRANPRRAN
jgi:hypothetical protein